MAARFVPTSRLSNILQMVTLSGQSGILRVMRGQGAQREIGQIRFVNGEPVSALLGQTTGDAALQAMNNWGECAYAFDEGQQSDPDSDPRLGASDAGYYTPTPSASSSWPSYGYSFSGPLSPPAGSNPFGNPPSGWPNPPSSAYPAGPQTSAPFPSLNRPNTPTPDYSSQPGYGGPEYPPSQYPQYPQYPPTPPYAPDYGPALPNLPNLRDPLAGGQAPQGAQGGYGQSTTTTTGLRPGVLTTIPARTAISEQVDQLPLDRRERMVLLLVDGQRTFADLTRLTRRSESELFTVLNHLRMLGLVVF